MPINLGDHLAIAFAHVEIVHAAGGSSAVGLSAYVTRSVREDLSVAKSYNFLARDDDLAHHEIFLPENAPERFQDGTALWNEAIARETTLDRQTGEVRFKTNAQVAKHVVLALPKELGTDEHVELLREFVAETYTQHGVAVEAAIHDDPTNPHAHLLVSTRLVTEKGFGRKARDLNPSFAYDKATGRRFVGEQDHINDRWEQAQNRFFQEHGLNLRVDDRRVVADVHQGPRWHDVDSEKRAASDAALNASADRMRDPGEVLEGITERMAAFPRRDLERFVQKNGLHGEERDQAVAAAMGHSDVLPLFDPESGRELGWYTTAQVRAQEMAVVDRLDRLHGLRRGADPREVQALVAERGLSGEQASALSIATDKQGLALIQGRAGTGKSYTVSAIRDAYERSQYQVVGLAPTNTVARDMAKDGFQQASTVHMALIDLERGRMTWNKRTVVIVDEAAMLDTPIMDRLTQKVADARAKLILVGDDRQLASVQRGGLFAHATLRYRSAELSEVRRQDLDWQRGASEAFSRGDMLTGLREYASRGHLTWSSDLDDSRSALVRDWAESSARNPDAARFVYASTNVEVNRLNAELRQIRIDRGEIDPGQTFTTVRGQVALSQGDRLQFYANERHEGIFNGITGTVTGIGHDRITVRTDAGRTVRFNPNTFQGYGHGYAGTVYRGQGKTQTEVFALYDNSFAWNPKTAYVGMTRHRASVQLYASRDLARDDQQLARQMGRTAPDGASLRYATEAEVIPLRTPDPAVDPAAPRTYTDKLLDAVRSLRQSGGLRQIQDEVGRLVHGDRAAARSAEPSRGQQEEPTQQPDPSPPEPLRTPESAPDPTVGPAADPIADPTADPAAPATDTEKLLGAVRSLRQSGGLREIQDEVSRRVHEDRTVTRPVERFRELQEQMKQHPGHKLPEALRTERRRLADHIVQTPKAMALFSPREQERVLMAASPAVQKAFEKMHDIGRGLGGFGMEM